VTQKGPVPFGSNSPTTTRTASRKKRLAFVSVTACPAGYAHIDHDDLFHSPSALNGVYSFRVIRSLVSSTIQQALDSNRSLILFFASVSNFWQRPFFNQQLARHIHLEPISAPTAGSSRCWPRPFGSHDRPPGRRPAPGSQSA
jgi:hypothetical protein